jgi:peptide/nickel transport system substrate-binding protein
MFDFEWVNRNLLSGAYTRTKSFFDNSELSSFDRPASESEKALLAPFRMRSRRKSWPGAGSRYRMAPVAIVLSAVWIRKAEGRGLRLEGRPLGPDGKQTTFELMLKGKENEQIAVAWQQTLQRSASRSPFARSTLRNFFSARSTTISTR